MDTPVQAPAAAQPSPQQAIADHLAAARATLADHATIAANQLASGDAGSQLEGARITAILEAIEHVCQAVEIVAPAAAAIVAAVA